MPALDRYQTTVENALIKDGWTITHHPLTLSVGGRPLHVDIGAERLLAAQKDAVKIAVEVKTFGSSSPVNNLQNAIGRYGLYEDVLAEQEPERVLYLAIPEQIYTTLFAEPIGQIALRRRLRRVIVFTTDTEEVRQWIT